MMWTAECTLKALNDTLTSSVRLTYMPCKLFKRKFLQAVALYSMVLESLASVANLFIIATKSLVPGMIFWCVLCQHHTACENSRGTKHNVHSDRCERLSGTDSILSKRYYKYAETAQWCDGCCTVVVQGVSSEPSVVTISLLLPPRITLPLCPCCLLSYYCTER